MSTNGQIELQNVQRQTSAKQTHKALDNAQACDEALEWIEEEMARHLRLTAQGLWNRCPNPEWLDWLCIVLRKRDGESNAGYHDIVLEAVNVLDIHDWCCVACNPDDTGKVLARVRRDYESPWLA